MKCGKDRFGIPLKAGDKVISINAVDYGRFSMLETVKAVVTGFTKEFICLEDSEGKEFRKKPEKVLRYEWPEENKKEEM